MSLEVEFSALSEGVAGDARGSLTLVAVNPHVLIADQLPAQFSPFLVVVIDDDDHEDPALVPGRTVTARIEAVGPDDIVLFVAQLRQAILPPPTALLRPRVQIIAQIPFTASKSGDFKISAHIVIVGEGEEVKGEVTAVRRVQVADTATLRPQVS